MSQRATVVPAPLWPAARRPAMLPFAEPRRQRYCSMPPPDASALPVFTPNAPPPSLFQSVQPEKPSDVAASCWLRKR